MNHGSNYPLYFSPPTTYSRYVDDSSPPLSGLVGLDQRLSTHQGHGDGNRLPSSRNGSFGLDHRRPSFQDNTRIGAATQYRPYGERFAIRPSSQTSIPMDPPRVPRIPPQVTVIGIISNGTSPGFPFSYYPASRPSLNQGMMNTNTPSETDNESKLTKEEQEQVLKKLKKEIYIPSTSNSGMLPKRRVSLYYRDLNRDPNYTNTAMDPKHNKNDEEGKRCAVCLEDFKATEEVMLTPCNHMFHEECIVPWVKSHGQCPVCRAVFCERIKENGSALSGNGNRPVALPADHGLFEEEPFSLIRAVNEAFPWVS